MAYNVSHFAIHADDVERARRFYEAVFGWQFEAWGPPGFYRIHTDGPDGPGIEGALHGRQEPLAGTGMRGFECTIAIDDPGRIKALVVEHGGEIEFDEMDIATVGTLFGFRDTEGNSVQAMRYEPGHV